MGPGYQHQFRPRRRAHRARASTCRANDRIFVRAIHSRDGDFVLFLPLGVIDLVVASVLMSMGMMLPPIVVSLPFKLIFFVLVDGWSLVAGSLVQSYGP
jgi:hypothetical protein